MKRGELNLKEAAELIGISYRQCRRLHKRHKESGDGGLVHRSRGQPSNRGHQAQFKAAVLARYQERYPDFGPTLAAGKLAADGYEMEHETLRHWQARCVETAAYIRACVTSGPVDKGVQKGVHFVPPF